VRGKTVEVIFKRATTVQETGGDVVPVRRNGGENTIKRGNNHRNAAGYSRQRKTIEEIAMTMNKSKNKESAPGMRLLGILAVICLCSIAMIPAVAAAGTSGSVASDAWSGTWDSQSSTPVAFQTFGVLTLTRSGSTVTGTFSNDDHGTGTISGTISGNQLTGTWTAKYAYESDSGSFTFVLSDDKKSFSGSWISASDRVNTISTTEDYWFGERR